MENSFESPAKPPPLDACPLRRSISMYPSAALYCGITNERRQADATLTNESEVLSRSRCNVPTCKVDKGRQIMTVTLLGPLSYLPRLPDSPWLAFRL